MTDLSPAAQAVEAVGPSDEELLELAEPFSSDVGDGFTKMVDDEIGYARAALARYGSTPPRPIPVAERLPGPEDCDAKMCYWLWNSINKSWCLHSIAFNPLEFQTNWLPAHAIPLPQENTND